MIRWSHLVPTASCAASTTPPTFSAEPGANYGSDYREFQGIKMRTKRCIYGYDQNMQKVPEPLLVSLDLVK